MGFAAAIIAASATLVTAWLTNFVGEEFKQFRKGTAVAALLLGEAKAFREAYERTQPSLDAVLDRVNSGESFPVPRSLKSSGHFALEVSGADIGLLGPEICEQVACFYSHLKGYGAAILSLSENQDGMAREEVAQFLTTAFDMRTRAYQRSEALVGVLHARATEHWSLSLALKMFKA